MTRRLLAALVVGLILGILADRIVTAAAPWSASDTIDFAPVVLPSLATGAPLGASRPRPVAIDASGRSEPSSDAVGAPLSSNPSEAASVPSTDAAGAASSEAVAGRASASVPRSLSGVRLTWYCLEGVSRCTAGYPPSCACVAVSPDLGWLRGRTFTLELAGISVMVRAVDCDCSARYAIDAYASVFAQLAPLSAGAVTVTVR